MKWVWFLGSVMLAITSYRVEAQQIRVVKFAELNQVLSSTDDTLSVVNFWATWCAPCVKELPYFEKLRQQTANKKIRILLISMDDRPELSTKVKPFVQKRKLQVPVWLLDEPDPNTWIDQIEPEWSGALPATLFINKKRGIRKFVGKPVSERELQALIKPFKL